MKTATKLISLVTCLCLLLCAFAVTAAAAEPAANSTLTIEEAIALGNTFAKNEYTEGKYYVTGVITDVYNTTFGNMKIADANGTEFTVYGTYSADGATRYDSLATKPVVGDTVTVYGVIGKFNAPQMKNGWITAHTPGTPVAPPPSNDPAADTELTIAQALELGASKSSNEYTSGKYYVTGKVTEVYGLEYGNMRITDDAGNILTVYGSYSADGSTRYDAMDPKPDAGDTVKFYGIIGQYKGTPQMKNAWIIEFTDGTPPVNNDPTPDTELTIPQALELGASKNHESYTQGKYYVTGVVAEVSNPQYGNMTIKDEAGNVLTIYGSYSADGSARYDAMENKPVAGDTVKVYGVIGQYNDTVQLKNGWIVAHTSAGGEAPKAPEDPKEIVDAAYALEDGKVLPYAVTLTGKIVSVDTPYSDDYKNITITIAIEGREDKPIHCYRLKGDGANALAAGDTVTVSGVVTNYGGKIQFNSGCKLDKVVAGTRVPATGDVSILMPAAAMLISGISTVALIIKKKEF